MEQNPNQTIRALYPTFTRVSRKIADYILEGPERMLGVSVHQMARELGVAESSIVRFCRTIGLSGFSELKIMLAKESGRRADTIFTTLADDDPETVTRNIFALNMESLQQAVEQMDFQAVSAAAERIRRAGRILVCGVGSSASISDNFAVHLMRIGMQAVSVTDGELMQVAARMADPDTLLIAVSKSGRNLPIVNAFRLARERGASTVGLTCYARTPLESHCDVCIVHYYPEATLVSARVIQDTIIDCLCINATIHRQEEVLETLRENREIVEPLRL